MSEYKTTVVRAVSFTEEPGLRAGDWTVIHCQTEDATNYAEHVIPEGTPGDEKRARALASILDGMIEPDFWPTKAEERVDAAVRIWKQWVRQNTTSERN